MTTNAKGTKSSCDQPSALARSLSPSFPPFPRELERKRVTMLSKISVPPGFDNFHSLGFLWNGKKLLFKN